MRRLLLSLLALLGAVPALAAQQPYKKPPQVIVDILDAAPLPTASVSPDRGTLLLMEAPAMPTIAEVAAPMLRLAGFRVNPRTNGPTLPGRITGLVLKRVADGTERRISLPDNPAVAFVAWAPDGRRIAFVQTRDAGLELWIADVATGRSRAVTGPTLNAAFGTPCQWLADATRLVCRFVPDGRGAAPTPAAVPVGPIIQENMGRASPVPTYQDLLESEFDAALFDHYFTAQLGVVDVGGGAMRMVGTPAVFDRVSPAPDGRHVLVSRTVRPYSFVVPAQLFPKEIQIWDLNADGRVVHDVARLPLAENIPIRGVRGGPRSITWRADQPATLVWAEALDGGDPRNRVPKQDKVVTIAAPFAGQPAELAQLDKRYTGIGWDARGTGLLYEYDRDRRTLRNWIIESGAAPRRLREINTEDRYANPGNPVEVSNAAGASVMLRDGDWIYFTGAGASPQGDRPFLDRLNLRTLRTERLWRADTLHYESVVALIDNGARQVLTRRESRTEPPNYFVRETRAGDGRLRSLTAFADPAPQLAGVTKRLVTYTRADGIPLSGTLYLPPGYVAGTRLPVVMWAYPTEFASAAAAGQVSATVNRFNFYRGASHLFFLTQGYAVFDDPKMPILGGDTANNHYVEQLVASARAAVNAVVGLGVADSDRIGVGGHSYGAFMTANLLAHSDLFRAGIARSGAYNRTLTPFGFQSEERTYWESPEVYTTMSPFMHADRINEPILMTHGEADNNTGTFPIQSERMYHALKGHGATVRFVLLPSESHGYAARESVLHTLAEMIEWFDRYVKQAPPRGAKVSSQ
jgi:dipeptidyl aminopeptidase/acylaminoacyl peptidase